jgi:hypothetical protein
MDDPCKQFVIVLLDGTSHILIKCPAHSGVAVSPRR